MEKEPDVLYVWPGVGSVSHRPSGEAGP